MLDHSFRWVFLRALRRKYRQKDGAPQRAQHVVGIVRSLGNKKEQEFYLRQPSVKRRVTRIQWVDDIIMILGPPHLRRVAADASGEVLRTEAGAAERIVRGSSSVCWDGLCTLVRALVHTDPQQKLGVSGGCHLSAGSTGSPQSFLFRFRVSDSKPAAWSGIWAFGQDR